MGLEVLSWRKKQVEGRIPPGNTTTQARRLRLRQHSWLLITHTDKNVSQQMPNTAKQYPGKIYTSRAANKGMRHFQQVCLHPIHWVDGQTSRSCCVQTKGRINYVGLGDTPTWCSKHGWCWVHPIAKKREETLPIHLHPCLLLLPLPFLLSLAFLEARNTGQPHAPSNILFHPLEIPHCIPLWN